MNCATLKRQKTLRPQWKYFFSTVSELLYKATKFKMKEIKNETKIIIIDISSSKIKKKRTKNKCDEVLKNSQLDQERICKYRFFVQILKYGLNQGLFTPLSYLYSFLCAASLQNVNDHCSPQLPVVCSYKQRFAPLPSPQSPLCHPFTQNR